MIIERDIKMAKSIDAKLKNIQGLFSSTNSQDSILGTGGTYIIPEYQRAYNWKYNEQCDKLWQDIESFIDNNKNDTYFFGSIIINSANDELYVIDGQQRMTTFILLLKALYIKINDVLNSMSTDEDTEILRDALKNRRKSILTCLYNIDEDDISQVTSGSRQLKDLTIKYYNKSINEEYSNDVAIILRENTLEDIEKCVTKIKYKQRDNRYTNFFRNFKFFLEKFEAYDSTTLNAFAKTLLNNCQVIVVVSYNTEEAIEIFNSLNSTGMPLADADILSAKLYSNFGSDKTEFNRRWSDIVTNTNKLKSRNICSIDDILNQYMYILRAKNNEKDTTLPGVRRYFTDINKHTLNDPRTFLSEFEQIIDIWTDETNDNADESKAEILTLKQILFNFNNNFKFFYATFMFFNQDKPYNEKLTFIKALLKVFALLAICDYGYSSSAFKVFLIGLNMEIGAGVSTKELVNLIETHIQNSFDKNSIFSLLKENSPANGLLYLNEYLFAKENNTSFSFSTQKTEIEHIMPESGKNIIAIRTDAGMDEDTFKQYVNKLGNKILLEQQINGSISNDWFRVKKQNSVKEKRGYKDSVFPIAQSLVAYPDDRWTKDDIDKATDKAAKRIVGFIFG